jgi:hypothetical protein
MGTIIFISIFLLLVSLFALSILSRQRMRKNAAAILRQPQFSSLFADEYEAEAIRHEEAEAKERAREKRRRLRERAGMSDVTVLDEAHDTGDPDFYRDALRRLIAATGGEPKGLHAISRYIVESGTLRSSREFAQTMIEQLSRSLDRQSLTEMLYLAALCDDAATFQTAVDLMVKKWREGKLKNLSAKELLTTTESAYWLIASEERDSGSSFLIKQAIANVRRELAAATRQPA